MRELGSGHSASCFQTEKPLDPASPIAGRQDQGKADLKARAGVLERMREPIFMDGHNRNSSAMKMPTLDTTEPETLCFGYGDTTLGTIVVAESMRGVVALFIGDDRTKLLLDLKDAFPGAKLALDQTG